MEPPVGTNMKLWRILGCVVRELESINSQAWYLSQDPKDTCGSIGYAIPDYTDGTLIKEIEMRVGQIEERKRYIAGLHGGEQGHRRACDFRADELYQKYCGKRG